MTNPAKPIKGKTKIKRLVLILIIIVLCVAAVTRLPLYSEDINGIVVSLPMPDYMRGLNSRCFGISQEPFWRLGVDGNDLSDYILENLHIYRNGELLTGGVFGEYEPGVALIRVAVLDENNNMIGYHGGAISFCLSPAMIADKWTHFRFEIVDLDGKLLSFNWLVLRD